MSYIILVIAGTEYEYARRVGISYLSPGIREITCGDHGEQPDRDDCAFARESQVD